jgi:hypothetical protein
MNDPVTSIELLQLLHAFTYHLGGPHILPRLDFYDKIGRHPTQLSCFRHRWKEKR